MPDYKKMYFELFNAVTDAINHLQKSQCEVEKGYIENEDTPVTVLLIPEDETQKATE